ncbi:MAG: DUF1684 domain-containing protein [Candidatus Dormibacteraeota bacterium]|nr:DUF1684 domain-containing protein [Candidatus Dormibacteraeota bacterium]MBV9524828.1 DUF1684 domain-containing protein [Candidatus Dormibacteraeota bacterium]
MKYDDAISLADWRRQVAALYAAVRDSPTPREGWDLWRAERERLFLQHPQSPLLPDERDAAHAPRYFDYDAEARVLVDVAPVEGDDVELPASQPADFSATPVGTARFTLHGEECALGVHWLAGYAGGIFVSFRDATSGTETYGAGRYLLDTAKSADLGLDGGRLVLDFNFAYQPSCSYDPRWACPLAPRENWLAVAVRAGERLAA